MSLLSFFVRVFVTFRKLFCSFCFRCLSRFRKKLDHIVSICFWFFIIAYALSVARWRIVVAIIALKNAKLYVLFFNYIFDLRFSALRFLNDLLSKLTFCQFFARVFLITRISKLISLSSLCEFDAIYNLCTHKLDKTTWLHVQVKRIC